MRRTDQKKKKKNDLVSTFFFSSLESWCYLSLTATSFIMILFLWVYMRMSEWCMPIIVRPDFCHPLLTIVSASANDIAKLCSVLFVWRLKVLMSLTLLPQFREKGSACRLSGQKLSWFCMSQTLTKMMKHWVRDMASWMQYTAQINPINIMKCWLLIQIILLNEARNRNVIIANVQKERWR